MSFVDKATPGHSFTYYPVFLEQLSVPKFSPFLFVFIFTIYPPLSLEIRMETLLRFILYAFCLTLYP